MKTNFELDRVYRLGDHTAIADASPPKYNGCGNGFIVIEKTTHEVVEMSYAEDGQTIDHDQNIAMSADAGTVLREDETFITVRANFSCWSACLF